MATGRNPVKMLKRCSSRTGELLGGKGVYSAYVLITLIIFYCMRTRLDGSGNEEWMYSVNV